jgi:ABC-type glycerol-3-phosphate transport system substrate-binding protein
MYLIRGFRAKIYALISVTVVIALAGCASPPSIGDQEALQPELALPTQTPAPLPTPSQAPESSVRGEVVIWMSYNPIELESLQSAIDAFTASNPDIAFALAYYPETSILDTFQAMATSRRRPTVLIGPSRWGPELYEQGEILDLSALIDAELQEDVYPAAWAQARSDVAVLGLPLELMGVLLYRNRALAEDPPASVAEWIEDQRALAEGSGYETVLDMGFTFSGGFLTTCGGRLEKLSDRSQIWGPAGLCWLWLLNDLAIPSRPVFNSEQDFQAFINAQSPWLIDLADRRVQLRAALGAEDLAVNPWPVSSDQSMPLRGYVWTENIYIASGTSSVNQEASWAFARYMLTREAQMIMADPSGAGHLPVIASAELDDPLMVESSAMLRSGVPWPLEFTDQEFLDALETAVANVVQQGSNPVFALNFAQESLGLPITIIPTATSIAE